MTKEEAITILKDISWQMGSVKRWENIEAIDMAIEALQTDLVRCKDCKWYNHLGCAIRIIDDSDKPDDNDFCSFGERSEE